MQRTSALFAISHDPRTRQLTLVSDWVNRAGQASPFADDDDYGGVRPTSVYRGPFLDGRLCWEAVRRRSLQLQVLKRWVLVWIRSGPRRRREEAGFPEDWSERGPGACDFCHAGPILPHDERTVFCDNCPQACYCSHICALRHWPVHRLLCTRGDLRAAADEELARQIAALAGEEHAASAEEDPAGSSAARWSSDADVDNVD